ncbi:hypothetical protein [Hydrogenophaga sp.]|uniref:hypothetical protein n=1 Tax=Hydrogenophaga sp. TaxID=1904254 RepID=UPI00271C5CC0|nr:hypothetical protein [Hydrogenophaga sp.]MDO8905297.1 hypothetical protein [Hydrogenophaga sp.]
MTVFDTVFYVQKLLERYTAAMREIKALKTVDDPAPNEQTTETAQEAASSSLQEVDLLNTSFLATAAQHAPIEQWLKSRQIEAQFDHANVDTTGYFDDAARLLGDRLDLFGELIDRVSYAYRKSHTSVNLDLSTLSQKDVQTITATCRQLHSQTLFSRYHYQKLEKVVRLSLQSAPKVRQFFDGGWLEWYALIELLQVFQSRKLSFSCARGVKVIFANEDLHELDVVALPAGRQPICIECKTGEFRREIDKYQRLRKRLEIDRSRFIVCASDITAEQASSFTAMYDLTFVNLSSLGTHLATLN